VKPLITPPVLNPTHSLGDPAVVDNRVHGYVRAIFLASVVRPAWVLVLPVRRFSTTGLRPARSHGRPATALAGRTECKM